MIQGGRSLGFPLETAEGLCVVGEFVGEELQGDVAPELQVFRLVHHTHAAAADPAEDAVMRNRLTQGFGRSGHWGEWYGGRLERVKWMDASQQKSPKFHHICRIIPNALTSLCKEPK